MLWYLQYNPVSYTCMCAIYIMIFSFFFLESEDLGTRIQSPKNFRADGRVMSMLQTTLSVWSHEENVVLCPACPLVITDQPWNTTAGIYCLTYFRSSGFLHLQHQRQISGLTPELGSFISYLPLCYLTSSERRAPAQHCDIKESGSIWHTWTGPLNKHKHERIEHFLLLIKSPPCDPVESSEKQTRSQIDLRFYLHLPLLLSPSPFIK